MSKVQKSVISAVVAGIVYQLWLSRNQAYWHKEVYSIRYCIRQVLSILRVRLKRFSQCNMKRKDVLWLQQLSVPGSLLPVGLQVLP